MTLQVHLGDRSYEIILERGCIAKAGEYLSLDRKVLVVTDSGVPEQYAAAVAGCCKDPVIYVAGQGERHKDLRSYEEILSVMLSHGFTRKDCVVAVGGGICGDLAGFAAATYMRGIDFYNVPTTMLAQVDSSIGGKTAVNLNGIKNAVGAFCQPRKVLIDPDVLETLPQRLISEGLAESLKMAVTFDETLFRILESEDVCQNLETIIERSLRIKAAVVEQDEKETGLRKVLNFGHTVGHGIESQCLDGVLCHGECVALGMLPMCSPQIRARLIPVLHKLHLPVSCHLDLSAVCSAMLHDKKAVNGEVLIIVSDRIGTYEMREADIRELRERAAVVVR